jgi:hypothetical protein
MVKGKCASCEKETLVVKVINSKNNLAVLSCFDENCLENAKIRVQYPPDSKRIREKVGITELSLCQFCNQVKTGVVANPGEGAPCSQCEHNPNKNKAAKLPKLWH